MSSDWKQCDGNVRLLKDFCLILKIGVVVLFKNQYGKIHCLKHCVCLYYTTEFTQFSTRNDYFLKAAESVVTWYCDIRCSTWWPELDTGAVVPGVSDLGLSLSQLNYCQNKNAIKNNKFRIFCEYLTLTCGAEILFPTQLSVTILFLIKLSLGSAHLGRK